jgi:molybdate transport system ATP-binding protein
MLIQVKAKKRVTAPGRVFSLEVDFATDSERLAFFGPSGSGKSLTLQLMAGLLTPEAGQIAVGDRVLFATGQGINVPARHRRVRAPGLCPVSPPHGAGQRGLWSALGLAAPCRPG